LYTSGAVNRVAVDKLNDSHSCVRDWLQSAAYHLQDILVRQERAGEVETDRQGMWLGRTREAHDRSRYDALADAERSHSVHRRIKLVVIAAVKSQY